jgi:hypothetical protein
LEISHDSGLALWPLCFAKIKMCFKGQAHQMDIFSRSKKSVLIVCALMFFAMLVIGGFLKELRQIFEVKNADTGSYKN